MTAGAKRYIPCTCGLHRHYVVVEPGLFDDDLSIAIANEPSPLWTRIKAAITGRICEDVLLDAQGARLLRDALSAFLIAGEAKA